MTTRREWFMKNPEKFYDYVWRLSGKRPYTLDKDRARSDGWYVGFYMCDNMDSCENCPVTCDDDGYCDDAIMGEWLDAPTTADMSDLVPEDREAVQKILDAAMKSAKKKKVMYSPSGTADFKEFNVTDAAPPRADGAETTQKASEMVKPAHYELLPNVNVLDVIKVILNRTCYEPDENFYLGNAIKYILRADEKNGTEDYKKAITYLTWLVESLE